jgi:transcriptional regulator with XRE-family HTH domain
MVMSDYSNLNSIIAANLVRLRQEAGLTQLQLAEKLNYSDKAVSKWERGESIPDVRVLMQIADIYHIKLDDIVTEQPEKVVKPKINLGKKRILITLLAVGLVWFIATGVFAILYFISQLERYAYLAYIVATFVSSVVLMVFSAMWGTRVTNAIASSLILWTLVVVLHIFFMVFTTIDRLWLFYVIGVPFQILIVLWYFLRKVNKNK